MMQQKVESSVHTYPVSPSPSVESGIDSDHAEQKLDGGLQAWIQVLGSWIIFVNTWGLTSSFGVFQTYYSHNLLSDSSPSSISWIGSIQTFLTLFMGALAGRTVDYGYIRQLLFIGVLLEVVGMFMTSLSSQYWHFLLSQGLCVGFGSGLLSLVSLAILPLYFKKRLMIAGGVAATGSGLAGVIYPIMLQHLFEDVGFGWAVRILAIVMFVPLCIAFFLIRPRAPATYSGPLVDLRCFREPTYTTFVIGWALLVAYAYVPYFYIEDYALALGVRKDLAFYLLSIMNVASFFGRFLPAWLADRYGSLNVLLPCGLLVVIIMFCFRFATSFAGLAVIGIANDFAAGGMVSLPPLTIAMLSPDTSRYGTRIGMGYTVAALGALLGNPIAGLFRQAQPVGVQQARSTVQKDFQGVWFFAGACMLVSVFLMLATRFLAVGGTLRRKI